MIIAMVERMDDYVSGGDPKKQKKEKKTSLLGVGISSVLGLGALVSSKKETGRTIGEVLDESRKNLRELNNRLSKQVIENQERKIKRLEWEVKKQEGLRKKAIVEQKNTEAELKRIKAEKMLADEEKLFNKNNFDKKFDKIYDDYHMRGSYKDKEWNLIELDTNPDLFKAKDFNYPLPCKNITILKTWKDGKTTTFTLRQKYFFKYNNPYIEYELFTIDALGNKKSRKVVDKDLISCLSKIEVRLNESTKYDNQRVEREGKKREEQNRKEMEDALKLADNGASQPDNWDERVEAA